MTGTEFIETFKELIQTDMDVNLDLMCILRL